MKKNILVYGLGNFGYAILKHLDIVIDYEKFNLLGFDRKPHVIQSLKKHSCHPIFHKDSCISKNIDFSCDPIESIKNVDILVLAITSSSIVEVLENLKQYTNDKIIILNTAKALSKNGNTYSTEIKEIFNKKSYSYSVISGGTIAKDLFLGYPLGATIGSDNMDTGNYLKNIFDGGNLHIEVSSDLLGVELAGSFKNIGSILAGYIEGKGYPYGSETYYITQFSKEISGFVGEYYEINNETFGINSQCWGNDYWMSCTGNTRNREFGTLLGKGIKFENAQQVMELQNKTVEGINTLKSLSKTLKLHKADSKKYPLLHKLILLQSDDFNLLPL